MKISRLYTSNWMVDTLLILSERLLLVFLTLMNMLLNVGAKWGELASNSCGIEVNNRTFRPQGPSSAVTVKYYRVKDY